jgi:WSC domain
MVSFVSYTGMNTFETIPMLLNYAQNGFKFDMINFMTMWFSSVQGSLLSTIQQSYQNGVGQSSGYSNKFSFVMCTGNEVNDCGYAAIGNGPVSTSDVSSLMTFASQQSSLAMVSLWCTNNDASNAFSSIKAMHDGTPTGPPGFQGCFADSSSRTLPVLLYRGYDNTIENCKTLCGTSMFSFAGLQNGNECWCGDNLPSPKLTETSCAMVCSGNPNQICGMGWMNSIYATGVQKSSGYAGCFVDSSARILPVVVYADDKNTVERCKSSCLAAPSGPYKYAGVQHGNECWCGNTNLDTLQKVEDTSCSMRCTGSSSQYCGAAWRNSIYATGYVGCYEDSYSRTLPVVVYADNQNTVELCKSSCLTASSGSYKFAGLQNGNECWCGNSVPTAQIFTDNLCSSRCTGNLNQFCGAAWKNSVYSTA